MTRIASTALESAIAPPISPAVPIKSGVVVPGLGTRPDRLLNSAFFPHPFNHLEVAMNIKPLFDRVVIKRMEEAKMSAGGIVLPDSATEKPIKAEDGAAVPRTRRVGTKGGRRGRPRGGPPHTK